VQADRWKEIERVFHEALAQPPARRHEYLKSACGGDDELRLEVQGMLDAHVSDPDFLETPVGDVSALGDLSDLGGPSGTGTIGPYTVVRPLGAGGMGEVYLARQDTEAFSRTVAIKVVKRSMDTDEVLRRFELERRILASLAHPNIAQLHDAGATEDGRPYFVMEFVDGERIDRFADRRGLSVDDRLHLFRTVCEAVQHAHQKLIVHRDIKPGNVLVREDGVVKLVDFGIGRLLSPDEGDTAQATRTRARRLTPDYASPEQIRGEPATTSADVYSLGVLLFELLTGRSPWPRDTESDEQRLDRTTTAPQRPSVAVASVEAMEAAARRQRARRLSGDLDNVVLKSMHPDPGRRYPSVAALSDDLGRHLGGLPVAARGDSFSYRSAKFVRRNAWSVSTAAAVVIGLIAVTATTSVQSRRIARERDKAQEVQSFLLETFGASSADGSSGDSTTVRQLLDGQAATVRTAYSADDELRAEMLAVLADAYERLGLLGDAEALSREALDERRRLHARDHPDVASTLNLLGWIRHEQGSSDEAVKLLTESVAMWRGVADAETDGLARALNDLGSVYDQLGRIDDAEPLLREALALRRARGGPFDRGIAVTSSNLATLMYRRGDYMAADSLGSAALEVLRRTVGPDHQRTFVAQSNLATFRWVAGDLDGAAAMYEDLLARQRQLDGGRSARTASAMVTYASLLRARGEAGEAESLLRDALEIQADLLDPNHRDIGNTARVLGIVLQQTGRPQESVAYLEQSLRVNRAAYGDRHRLVAESLVGLARSNVALNMPDRARADLEEGIEIFLEALGPAHPRTLDTRLLLAESWLDAGRRDRAMAVLAAVEERLDDTTPAAISDRARALRTRLDAGADDPVL